VKNSAENKEQEDDMKVFQATIESNNSCYVETVLVVAENEKQADVILCKHEKRKVKYTQKLMKVKISLTKPHVIPMVGWGENESNNNCDSED
jgi:hypothetical protein